MADVLYLTHRMPFPPDKGDKITSFNFLRHLATRHRVHLGCFVDSEADWQHVDEMKRYCASMKLVGIKPGLRKLMSARALLMGASITEVYHRSSELQAWVDETAAQHRIRLGLAYCSAMAPYLSGARHAAMRRVANYADVDSEKWVAYAQTQSGPMTWVYRREARTLLALERRMSARYDITSFVSDADAQLYRELAPEVAGKVRVIPNGVDTVYFSPDLAFDSPFEAGTQAIVFTGAMDYWPNADAVVWFANEVFPSIRAQVPQAQFWIVGSNPAPEVRRLATLQGVQVTGRVPDVRPYLAHAGAVVAPLRVARGVQNKVLEAYAMAKNVVLTRASANGLQPTAFSAEQIGDETADQVRLVLAALQRPNRFEAARDYVMQRYSWQYTFQCLDAALTLGDDKPNR